MSLTNRHPETGVRYTIYHINNDLHPDVWDTIYSDGVNLSDREYLDALELRVRDALQELPDEVLPYLNVEYMAEEILDTALCNGLQDEVQCDEPVYEGETDGIKWRTTWLGGAPHLFVFESPYYGVGRECSPCVQGAVDSGTITAIFRDEATAAANAADGAYGYALPTTWLRGTND